MNIRNMLVKMATVSVLALSGANAHASIGFPATICQKVGTLGTYSTYKGSVSNGSTTDTLTVTCPLPSYFSTAGWVSAYFQAFDRSSSNVTCTLRKQSVPYSGDIDDTAVGTASTTGNDSSHVQSPSFGSFYLDTGVALFADCTIPPLSNGWYNHLIAFYIN